MKTNIRTYELPEMREIDLDKAAAEALASLRNPHYKTNIVVLDDSLDVVVGLGSGLPNSMRYNLFTGYMEGLE